MKLLTPFSPCIHGCVLVITLILTSTGIYAADQPDKILTPFQPIIIALDSNNLAQAETMYQELSDAQQDSMTGQLIGGRLMMGRDQYDDAEIYLGKLVAANPDSAEAHYMYGWVSMVQAQRASLLSKLGYAKTGKKHLRKAIELAPQHVKALELLAQFYNYAPSLAGGDEDKAIELAQRVKAIEPVTGVNLLSAIAANHDDEQAALAIIQQALAEPALIENGELYYRKALLLQQLERWKDARVALKNAFDYAGDDRERILVQYQVARTAVLSQTFSQQSLDAMKMVISDAEHVPEIDINWAYYRAAQLYLLNDDQANAAKYHALALQSADEDLAERLQDLEAQL